MALVPVTMTVYLPSPIDLFPLSLCRNIINAPYRRTPGTYSWTLPWWSMMTCPTMTRKERGQCWSMTLLNMLGQSFEASPLKFRVRALVKLWLIITAQELCCFFKLEKICDHMILTRGCNDPIVLSLLNGLCVLEMWCLNCYCYQEAYQKGKFSQEFDSYQRSGVTCKSRNTIHKKIICN